jgi:hypothetical protein
MVMTRYVLAYFGNAIRGPFDFATEAAIAALFVRVGNPEGLEIVPIAAATPVAGVAVVPPSQPENAQ